MVNSDLTLFIEINNSKFSFSVGKKDDHGIFKFDSLDIQISGIEDNRIDDLEKVYNTLKENIYSLEKKNNFTFREIILILDNFDPLFLNISGFKKLNGSQVLKENITYILNSLKSFVNEVEPKKTILHIFNSKFLLDNKKVYNLPIGLFGDFYCHELSFALINTSDLKNLKNIFSKCDLKISKIFLKSFVIGANISENNKDIENFFHIKIDDHYTKILYFENNSLKFEQKFKFGNDIIIKDISKITSLKRNTVIKILENIQFDENLLKDELIEEIYFKKDVYKKVKKKLVYEIIIARAKEISEILIFKNINVRYHNKVTKNIFLEIINLSQFKSLKEIYENVFSDNKKIQINFLKPDSAETILKTTSKLVHFGWKTEAIPISNVKKSMITRFFETIFG